MKSLSWRTVLISLLLLKLVFHFATNGIWSVHRDALLYLALGRHLDWGYASVPPLISGFAWIATHVLGGSVHAVRFLPTVFATATVLLTGLMAIEFLPQRRDASCAKFAVLLVGLAGLLSGGFLRPGMLFQPVVFDIFFWTLLCWIFLKYVKTERSQWLLWFGVAAGFGLLNKYTVLMFLFAMLPGLLLTQHRRIFTQKHFYIGVALALILVFPNIYWQYSHQFPVFRHMSELAATQFVNVTRSGFFMDQLMFHLPALPVWMLGLYYLWVHPAGKPYRIFGWMYGMALAVLLFFNAKSYYSLGAYPVLIAAGAALWGVLALRTWPKIALIAGMLIIGLPIMPVVLPVFPPDTEAAYVQKVVDKTGMDGMTRWEDGQQHPLPQDFADMLGWEELAIAAGKTWQQIPDKSTAAIYAENYGQAGAIEHFGRSYGIRQVLSFSDNYRYWLPDSLPANFQTLIYVNSELGADMPGFFTEIEKIWELDMPLSRQHGNQVYLCKNPTPAFFERIDGAIRAAKNEGVIK